VQSERTPFHFDVVAASPSAPNAFIVVAARKEAFSLSMTLTSEEEQWVFPATEFEQAHNIPLLGLGAEKTWTVEASFIDSNGDSFDTKPREIQTPPLPENFPIFNELVGSENPLGHGYLLFDLKTVSDEYNYLVVLDTDMEVVWWQEDPRTCSTLHQQSDGTILGICNHLITKLSMTGETLFREPIKNGEDHDLSVHHELHPLPNGDFLTLSSERVEVDAYPSSESEPNDLSPAEIRGDQILQVSPDLTVIQEWHVSDLLPTSRIGFDSVSKNPEVNIHDWSHSNGVIMDPRDNGIIVSVRHQDAVFKMNSDGALQWILANPEGWPEAWQDYLLEGVGDFKYPFHQHAPELDDEGRLWIFDNGNYGSTPYSETDDRIRETSRVVAYEIDEEMMQFEQAYSFDLTALGKRYSSALGDADWLPHINSVLSVWGRLHAETDSEVPLPTNFGLSSHILLHKPGEDAPSLHLEMDGCRCDSSVYENEHRGWNSYRAQWIESLYPQGNGPTIVELEAIAD